MIALTLSFGAARVLADGFITCIDGSESGGGDAHDTYGIPVHNFSYSFDDGQSFVCGPLDEACGEIYGDLSFANTYTSCEGGDGGEESAAFWITSDGCYNIESGGNHMFCCPGSSESCVTTGFSRK
jgi:hypothetical protein